MPAQKEKAERFEVVSVRIKAAHLDAIRERGISLGPHVRKLVESLLAGTLSLPWRIRAGK